MKKLKEEFIECIILIISMAWVCVLAVGLALGIVYEILVNVVLLMFRILVYPIKRSNVYDFRN